MPANNNGNSGMMPMIMMMVVGCAFLMSSACAGYYLMMNPDLLNFMTPVAPEPLPLEPTTTTTESSESSTKKSGSSKSNSKSKSTSRGKIPSKASAYIFAEDCATKKNHVLAAGVRGRNTGNDSVSLWCAEPVKFYFDGPYSAGSEKFYYLRTSSNKDRALMWNPSYGEPYLGTYAKSDANQQWVIAKNDDGRTYSIKNRGIAKAGHPWVYLQVHDCDRVEDMRHFIKYYSSPHKFTFHTSKSTMRLLPNEDCPK